MAQRQAYKKHFLHSDPLSSASRTTRYRILKRLRVAQSESSAEVHVFADTGATTETTSGCSQNTTDNCDVVCSSNASSHPYHEANKDDSAVLKESSDDDAFVGEYFTTDITDDFDLTESEESDEVPDIPQESLHTLDSGSVHHLFENCPLSVAASTLLIKKFQMRHNLTNGSLTDLLCLLRLHFPSPNQFPASLYHFNKLLPVLRDPLEFTCYCSKCFQEISDKQETTCPNQSCQNSLTSETGALSSFIEVPLEPQLITILQS